MTILALSVQVTDAYSQDYNFRSFSSLEGLAAPYVYSVIQDSQGYLWVGTADGLSKFNGFTFQTFTTLDSLADNFITSSIDEGICLWFGHMNGRITWYDGKEFRPVDYKGRELSPITHFAKSTDGRIWVSTLTDGLFRLEHGEILFESNIFPELKSINTFAFTKYNELLIGSGSGLLLGKIGTMTTREEPRIIEDIPLTKVTQIREIRDDSGFYIVTENEGIFTLKKDSNLFIVKNIDAANDFNFTNVQSLCEDNQSNLWIGSFRSGLIKFVPGTEGKNEIIVFNKSSGFVSDNVKTIYEDSDGSIWSGNYGEGLTQINPRLFSIRSYDINSYGNKVFAVCSDKQFLWLGTEKGLLKTDRQTGETISFFSRESGLPEDTVSAIFKSDDEALWIGTYRNGLYLLNPRNGKMCSYQIGNGTLENSITVITGKDDLLWVGTKKGLCSINRVTNAIVWYSINKGGLPHNSVNSLYLDNSERLWISTNSSILSYMEEGKINRIPLGMGSGILTLGSVCEDDASRIWVGSKGNGVFIIDFDSILYLTSKQGLLSDYCYSLVSDNHYNIWIGHKGGLSRVRTSDYSVKPLQNNEGVPNDYQCLQNAILVDEDQRLIVGSDKGLIIYDPGKELPVQVPPVLGFTSIRVNDEEIDFEGNRITLSPGRYKIRIDYFGASLKEPALVTYQYMLEGYEQWSEITKSTNVIYNQLTDGEYSFLLKASSGDGETSESPLELTIIIKTPVWKKWWFYLSTAIILSFLIILYVKWRIRRLIAEKRILEEKVIERTHEIENQKNEIEKQRDTIELTNSNITSSITYASQIQQAVLPPIELIERLLPQHFILFKPKDIVSGDFYWVAEKSDKIIFSVSDCTGHGVPGAFMSLLGITLLNEIVNIHGITRSDEILNALRERVVQSLLQNRMQPQTKDGMDIALCVLDRKRRKLQYTGGMNDLVYLSGGERMLIKADFMDVSPAEYNRKKFTLNEMDYKDGDMIYLFSDGYQDQFGGDFDKKFLRPHFYNTLYEMSKYPVIQQHKLLEEKLSDWMKSSSQTDDITVMGIRL